MEALPDWVEHLELLAHRVRVARAAQGGSVADRPRPEVQALLGELCEVVAARYGQAVADAAVTDWLLTDRPVGDVVAFHRLVPDTRVQLAEREGVVVAPADETAELACRLDPLFLRVWVAWNGGGMELVRVATLDSSAS